MTSLEGMSHIHIGPEINCGDVEQLNVSCFDCSKKINSSKFFAIFFMSAILTGVAITGETFYFLSAKQTYISVVCQSVRLPLLKNANVLTLTY